MHQLELFPNKENAYFSTTSCSHINVSEKVAAKLTPNVFISYNIFLNVLFTS
jgi:hypothetical protein